MVKTAQKSLNKTDEKVQPSKIYHKQKVTQRILI